VPAPRNAPSIFTPFLAVGRRHRDLQKICCLRVDGIYPKNGEARRDTGGVPELTELARRRHIDPHRTRKGRRACGRGVAFKLRRARRPGPAEDPAAIMMCHCGQ
jgi:hypothetical protein